MVLDDGSVPHPIVNRFEGVDRLSHPLIDPFCGCVRIFNLIHQHGVKNIIPRNVVIQFTCLSPKFPPIFDCWQSRKEIVKDPKTKDYAPQETALLMEFAKNHRLLIGKGGLYGNVIRIAPALNITRTESQELLTKMGQAFEDLKNEAYQ